MHNRDSQFTKFAVKDIDGRVEVLDLRTRFTLDEEAILALVCDNNKVMGLTVEPINKYFTRSIVGLYSRAVFHGAIDASIRVIGFAVLLNSILEKSYLLNGEEVADTIGDFFAH